MMLAQHSLSFSPGRRRPHAEATLDLEGLALAAGSNYEDTWRSSRWRPLDTSAASGYTPATCNSGGVGGSGLPLVCSNCGVSFFSLLVADDELECYCSGECKWSFVMYREMDRRVRALRRHLRAVAAAKPSATSAGIRVPTGASPSGSASSVASTTDSESYGSSSPLLDGVISCR
ncbi:hypothetical protein PybrP1_002357 [[Pythium] brassicae (nom. inval.)]|nr:hypothetical protein PybrP1_002357 [[Pythium] brassicae (nom. inval.)]